MFMAQIERRIQEAQKRYLKSSEFKATLDWAIANPGRTVAIRPPSGLRDQIDRIQEKHGFSSVKNAVLACVIIGIRVLEEASADEAA